jgi:mannosyltransferase
MSISESEKITTSANNNNATQIGIDKAGDFTRSATLTIAKVRLHPIILLTGITCFALFLSFLYLGSKSLWFDESISIGIARSNWPTLFHIIAHGEANMSLYYILLHFWTFLGSSEFIVRSFSAIFAVLTVPIVFALGSRLFNKWVGLLAALLLTINPFFIQYAQEARSYSLVLFLVSLSSLIFVAAIQRPTKWLWAGYIIISVLAVYAHVFAVFVLAGQVTSLLFLRREHIPWRWLLISGATVILFISPLLANIALTSTQNLGYVLRPRLGDIKHVLSTLAGSTTLLGTSFVLGLIAFDYGIREWSFSGKSPKTWRYALILCWLIAPIAISLGVSQFKPIFGDRYLIICSVPLALLIAIGISKISRRWILVASIVVVLGISGFQLSSYYQNFEKEDWRGATTYVLSETQKGDAIVFYTSYVSTPFSYYQEKAGAASEAPVSVPYFDPHIYTPTPVLNVPAGYSVGGKMPPVDMALTSRLSGYDRIWLVISHEYFTNLGRDVQAQTIQNMLQEKYGISSEKDFNSIRIFLLTPKGLSTR